MGVILSVFISDYQTMRHEPLIVVVDTPPLRHYGSTSTAKACGGFIIWLVRPTKGQTPSGASLTPKMQVASATATGIVGNAIEPMPMTGTMQQEDATHMIWLNLYTTTRRRRAAQTGTKMMFVFRD